MDPLKNDFVDSNDAIDAGDEIADALFLDTVPVTVEGTLEIDDQEDWFVFTAPFNGEFTVSLSNLQADTDLQITDENGDPLVFSNSGGTTNEGVGLDIIEGEDYWINVSMFNEGEETEYFLDMGYLSIDDDDFEDNPFTLYDSGVHSASDLLDQIAANAAGIEILDVNYIGADHATSFFDSIDFGAGAYMDGPGILLSTGDGAPAIMNTSGSYTVANDEPGDDQFTDVVQQAFLGAGETNDAAILEFSFQVTDPGVKSISFDLMFGSDEYPEFADTSFVDIAALTVNGVNYALFDNDESKPLSITSANVDAGSLYDNTGEYDYFDDDEHHTATYGIEYDGISPRLTINIPLDADEDVFEVRLGVADTGDTSLDSALMVSNFITNLYNLEGLQVEVTAPEDAGGDEDHVIQAAGEDTATSFNGNDGNNIFEGSTAPDVYDLGADGGDDTVQGTGVQLINDTLLGFESGDKLIMSDIKLSEDDIALIEGVAFVGFDAEGEGTANDLLFIQGDFTNGEFKTADFGDGTIVTFESEEAEQASSEEKMEAAGSVMSSLSGEGVTLSPILTSVFGGILGNLLSSDGSGGFEASSAFSTLVKVFTFIATPESQRPASFLSYSDDIINSVLSGGGVAQENAAASESLELTEVLPSANLYTEGSVDPDQSVEVLSVHDDGTLLL